MPRSLRRLRCLPSPVLIGTGFGSLVAWAEVLRTRAKRADEATRRLAFLGEADTLLAGSLAYRDTLQRIAGIPVPELAELCMVDVLTEDGRIERAAVAHTDRERIQAAFAVTRRWPLDPDGPSLIARVLRGGEPVVSPITAAHLETLATDAEHLALLEQLGAERVICLPLSSREGTIGVMTLGGPALGEAQLGLARDLAARCSLALDASLLYEATSEARRHAEAQRERAALLAEASSVFDQSLDEAATRTAVEQMMARHLATACEIVTDAHQVSGDARVVIDTGRPLVDGSVLVVPLRARGRTIGAMRLHLSAPPDEALRELCLDIGRRAALAIDNARLFAERAHVARTLQQSLLPPALPHIPGLELAARYDAAGEGIEVGGDFYDCYPTAPGEWAVAVGDVCGKGAEAAAVTALARYTLRASVGHERRPRAVLQDLNEAILRQRGDYRFCSVAYLALRPQAGRLHVDFATGGHPLPLLLRADGRVETLGAPGTLVGIMEQPRLSEAQAVLGPGDALVAYTDGVIEASPADDAFGPDRFAAFLGTCAGMNAEAIATAVERAVLGIQDGGLRDDVAIVVARVTGVPAVSGDGARGSDSHVSRLLVLTPEPVDDQVLRSALGSAAGVLDDAEVQVVAYAAHDSKLAFWMSDADEAIRDADRAAVESTDRLEESGVAAAGDVGESEPLVALQDALQTFPADRVILVRRPEGERGYREDLEPQAVSERFGVPVSAVEVSRD